LGIEYFVCHRIVLAVKGLKFGSDRMLYIVLRGRWGHIIVFNAHTPTEEKSDDSIDSVNKESKQVFSQFPK
jgi:hypothetical protein